MRHACLALVFFACSSSAGEKKDAATRTVVAAVHAGPADPTQWEFSVALEAAGLATPGAQAALFDAVERALAEHRGEPGDPKWRSNRKVKRRAVRYFDTPQAELRTAGLVLRSRAKVKKGRAEDHELTLKVRHADAERVRHAYVACAGDSEPTVELDIELGSLDASESLGFAVEVEDVALPEATTVGALPAPVAEVFRCLAPEALRGPDAGLSVSGRRAMMARWKLARHRFKEAPDKKKAERLRFELWRCGGPTDPLGAPIAAELSFRVHRAADLPAARVLAESLARAARSVGALKKGGPTSSTALVYERCPTP